MCARERACHQRRGGDVHGIERVDLVGEVVVISIAQDRFLDRRLRDRGARAAGRDESRRARNGRAGNRQHRAGRRERALDRTDCRPRTDFDALPLQVFRTRHADRRAADSGASQRPAKHGSRYDLRQPRHDALHGLIDRGRARRVRLERIRQVVRLRAERRLEQVPDALLRDRRVHLLVGVGLRLRVQCQRVGIDVHLTQARG
ncbi:hypothetical protein [Burkholderia sp. IDO3]|uniref:hypothetical protein n=1 Tax=Burkholderia sp. IDO3 TaxID=1705310 RepID=UPI001F085C28|nr:hypothetical protein [Burkholderia sp. IDO3]